MFFLKFLPNIYINPTFNSWQIDISNVVLWIIHLLKFYIWSYNKLFIYLNEIFRWYQFQVAAVNQWGSLGFDTPSTPVQLTTLQPSPPSFMKLLLFYFEHTRLFNFKVFLISNFTSYRNRFQYNLYIYIYYLSLFNRSLGVLILQI